MAKQQGTAKRGMGIFILAAVVIAVVAVGVVIYFNQRNAGETVNIEENDRYDGIPLGGDYADTRDIERGEDVPEGVERGITAAGVPYIGNPNAPITVGEFMDFTCPHCATYAETFDELVQVYGRNGLANFELYILPAEARAPQSRYGARAAFCAAQQGAFWEMHDELFRVHLAESTNAFDENGVVTMAERLGLDGDALRECVNSNQSDAALLTARNLAADYGIDSTPTLMYRLGGTTTWTPVSGGREYEVIARLIEQANGIPPEG